MSLLTETTVNCPHCGESIEIDVDPSGGREQSYVEDCWVCCRPIAVKVEVSAAGEIEVNVRQAD
jgi:hypothetical protein